MNYEFIEREGEERSKPKWGLDPLGNIEIKTELSSLGVKWSDGEYWYGFWGEYTLKRREEAWRRIIDILLTGKHAPLSEGTTTGSEFILV